MVFAALWPSCARVQSHFLCTNRRAIDPGTCTLHVKHRISPKSGSAPDTACASLRALWWRKFTQCFTSTQGCGSEKHIFQTPALAPGHLKNHIWRRLASAPEWFGPLKTEKHCISCTPRLPHKPELWKRNVSFRLHNLKVFSLLPHMPHSLASTHRQRDVLSRFVVSVEPVA